MPEVSLEERRKTYRGFLVGSAVAIGTSAGVLIIIALILA